MSVKPIEGTTPAPMVREWYKPSSPENNSTDEASPSKTVAKGATGLAGPPGQIENVDPTNSAVVSLPSVKPSVSLTNLHYKRVEKS